VWRNCKAAADDEDESMPIAAIAGLVVACVAVTAIVLTCYWYLHRRRRLELRRQAPSRASVAKHDAAVREAVLSLPVHSHVAAEEEVAPESVGGGLQPATECSVCLAPFATGDMVKTLPCRHAFHQACIDQWLLDKGRQRARAGESVRGLAACPLCKVVPITVPVAAGGEAGGVGAGLEL